MCEIRYYDETPAGTEGAPFSCLALTSAAMGLMSMQMKVDYAVLFAVREVRVNSEAQSTARMLNPSLLMYVVMCQCT